VKTRPRWAEAERRKVVTVVFADVVGSTALGERVDPETLRWAMQHWFERMAEAIERHGGTVENYVGDAVMAVFGIPVAHEDDALRAVRAAADMREQVAVLRAELVRERGVELAVRIGVNTGEAVTGISRTGGSFTSGDIVNVGARLEQSARPGDILLGRDTFRLVRHAVDAEPVPPLSVKGKEAPLEAFRLISVAPDAYGRPQRVQAPMVDREPERRQLMGAFERALTERSCQLVTVLGPAGVGKSRLVADIIDGLRSATVAVGRCLPYGDGLTWWPLAEALGTSGLLDQVAANEPVLARAVEVLKPTGEPVSTEEAFWAMRRALEALARRRPVVLVVDDLHWAESTFIDFLEHVTDRARDVPLMLLATARPELRDDRPGWGEDRTNATSVLLEPLAEEEMADLLRHLLGTTRLGTGTAARILDVAEGYPLFVVEVVAMLADDGVLSGGDGHEPAELSAIAVPPTIQTLIAARLDRLGPAERAVIEAAAIEGKEFTRSSVAALVGDGTGPSVGAELRALVAKELIRPEGSGDEVFRFHHQLIRDTAYDGISKALRADLHERHADWLQAQAATVVAPDELLGYHLERAVVLRRELGESDASTAALAARASASLSAAGRRAAQRDDQSAACALLERAISLVDSDDAARGALLPALGASLFEAGRMTDAIRVLDDAIVSAPEPWLEARARIEREFVRLETGTSLVTDHARVVVDEVLPVLERRGDDHGQCRAWSLRAQAAWNVGHVERADAAWGEAADCARRAADERELFAILGWRATAAVFGLTPVDEAIARCEQFRDRVSASPVAVAWAVNALAYLHAMRREFDLAERFLQQANETLHQLGSLHSTPSHIEALIRLLMDRPALAEAPLRADIEALAPMGAGGLLATTTAMLAQAVFAQGRVPEAYALCQAAARAAPTDDIFTHVIWRSVKAKILAAEGRCDQAEALAREAVALVKPTDLLSLHGDAMLDLAEVLRTCGRTDDSDRAVRTGLSLYENKGNAAGAARARSRIRSEGGEQ
jgi:class 3 adenylate cyclase/tetratricopeptide (TPR) repeat protein/CheY-like chemotaxis protein